MTACVFLKWMGTTEATNWITLAGFLLAVLAFWYQGRATRKQLVLQNLADYTKRYQEIILKFPENINEPIFSLDALSDQETRDRTLRYMRAYFDLCSEELGLFNAGYIDKMTWQTWKEGMLFAFSKPAFRQAWEIISKDTHFGKEFTALVKIATESRN